MGAEVISGVGRKGFRVRGRGMGEKEEVGVRGRGMGEKEGVGVRDN